MGIIIRYGINIIIKEVNDLTRPILIMAAIIFTLAYFVSGCTSLHEKQAADVLRIHYIDVGQGDSVLIQVNSKNMLIDAGPEANEGKLTAYLKKQKVKELDYIIATHPHEDHIGAMASVLDSFQAGSFYAPRVITDTRSFYTMIATLKKMNKKIIRAQEGVLIDLGKNTQCYMLSPCSENYSSLNDYSPTIMLTFGDTSFLFMGDAEGYSENEILSHHQKLECDVLKSDTMAAVHLPPSRFWRQHRLHFHNKRWQRE
jgi:competence protein ComEC